MTKKIISRSSVSSFFPSFSTLPRSESRNTDKDNHIDNGGKSHRQCTEKKRLLRMNQHDGENLWPDCIASDGEDEEDDEEGDVEDKDGVCDVLESDHLVREVVQDDRGDAYGPPRLASQFGCSPCFLLVIYVADRCPCLLQTS
jgi:hypothetical protein